MGKHRYNKTKKGGLYTTPLAQSNYEQPSLFTQSAYSAPQAPPVENKSLEDNFKEKDAEATKAVTDGVKNISQSVANLTNPVVEPVKGFFGNLWDNAKKLVKKPEPKETIGSSMGIPVVGGKKRRGGGFRPSHDYGIAASGAPVNGIKTANANSYIGGKKSKRGKRKGSRKSRKSHKKK